MRVSLTVVLLLFYCISFSQSYKYKVTNTKIAGWGTLFVAGVAGGMEAGFQFDHRKSFERKYNVDPNGFWGSQSWRRVYVNGDPNQGFKSGLHRRVGSLDFYHISNKTMRFGYIGGSLTIGINARKNNNWKHTALDIIIGVAASTIGQNLGMYYIRN